MISINSWWFFDIDKWGLNTKKACHTVKGDGKSTDEFQTIVCSFRCDVLLSCVRSLQLLFECNRNVFLKCCCSRKAGPRTWLDIVEDYYQDKIRLRVIDSRSCRSHRKKIRRCGELMSVGCWSVYTCLHDCSRPLLSAPTLLHCLIYGFVSFIDARIVLKFAFNSILHKVLQISEVSRRWAPIA